MKGLALGQTAQVMRTFSPADIVAYRTLSMDEYLQFGRHAERDTIPGPLLGGLFSYLLGTKLPGRGTNWLKQQLAFPQPAYVGEAITATVEIIRLRPEKELINLRTLCTNPAGTIVCRGEALVLVRDLEEEPDLEVLLTPSR